jgi:hypothetical protein
MLTALTPADVQAEPVFGSVVSVRHIQDHVVASVAEPVVTVVVPDLRRIAPLRDPASLFSTKPRVVTATVDAGVTPIEAML